MIEDNEIHKINVVSDSPTSQYRNKSSFWFMHQFATKHNITLKWIFSEANHGKGVPDGIGGDGKRAIADIIRFNPDNAFYGVNDLLPGMCKALPSIQITTYTGEEVKVKASLLQKLKSIDGTAKGHEGSMVAVAGGKHRMLMNETSDQQPTDFIFAYEKNVKCLKKEQREYKKKSSSKNKESDNESDNESEDNNGKESDDHDCNDDDTSSSESESDDNQ